MIQLQLAPLPPGYTWRRVPGKPPEIIGRDQIYQLRGRGQIAGTIYPPPEWVQKALRPVDARWWRMS